MELKKGIKERRISLESCGELSDRTVHINRVAKVVKGGRRFSFSALIVAGDGSGHVGVGMGKAGEVPEAIRKGVDEAHLNLVRVPLRGGTIPHEVIGRFGASRVVMRPGQPGTGVIAGSVGRAIAEAAGIKDIRMKCLGSVNPQNVLKAVMDGLLSLREPETIASGRGITLDEMGYQPY
jgi:small subunit ribosomal protein S5